MIAEFSIVFLGSLLSSTEADQPAAVGRLSVDKVTKLAVIEYDVKALQRARIQGKPVVFPPIRVELIEKSHVQCKESFDQILLWDKYPNGEQHLREWRIVNNEQQVKVRRKGNLWEARWSREGITHTVLAPKFRQTTSMIDPELTDRDALPKQNRIPLWVSKQSRHFQMLLKRYTKLMDMGRLEEAAFIAREALTSYPTNKTAQRMFAQSTLAQRISQQQKAAQNQRGTTD